MRLDVDEHFFDSSYSPSQLMFDDLRDTMRLFERHIAAYSHVHIDVHLVRHLSPANIMTVHIKIQRVHDVTYLLHGLQADSPIDQHVGRPKKQ